MNSPDKLSLDDGLWLRKLPRIDEALIIAQGIEAINDPAERKERLLLLNHHMEPNVGEIAWINSPRVYRATPWGLNPVTYDDVDSPFIGSFEGFVDITIPPVDEDDESSVKDNPSCVCVKLLKGQSSFSNEYTSGTFEHIQYFTLEDVLNIQIQAELERLFTNKDEAAREVDQGTLFSELLKIIENGYGDTQTPDSQYWEYRDPDIGLMDIRKLCIIATAQYGKLQQESDIKHSVEPVEDLEFYGFFLGIVNYFTKRNQQKPHFAFEVYGCADRPEIGQHSERIAPVLFVPISPEVMLDVDIFRADND